MKIFVFGNKKIKILLGVIKNLVLKVARMMIFFLDCYKNGGVTYANITQINSGESLTGKRVLITGGASGIGLAIAKKAISEGATVVITGRNIVKLKSALKKINSDSLFILQWDVTDLSILDSKLEEAFNLMGGTANVLVNNAGILLEQNFLSITEDTWEKIYSTNSKAVFFLNQAIGNILIKKKLEGKIINISSTSAFYGVVVPYGMTKWDIAGLTEGLGKKLAPYGIIVNGIAPGRTATVMLDKGDDDNIYDSLTSAKRFAMPEEIAELAIFLMSDATNFIVGQTIVCDGGYILKA